MQKKVTALINSSSKSIIGQLPKAVKRDGGTRASDKDLISRGEQQTVCRIFENFKR